MVADGAGALVIFGATGDLAKLDPDSPAAGRCSACCATSTATSATTPPTTPCPARSAPPSGCSSTWRCRRPCSGASRRASPRPGGRREPGSWWRSRSATTWTARCSSTPPRGGHAPYDRLIGAALEGDRSPFTPQDAVEAAWRVVDQVLGDVTPVHPYAKGTWGPEEAGRLLPDRLLPDRDAWHDPAG